MSCGCRDPIISLFDKSVFLSYDEIRSEAQIDAKSEAQGFPESRLPHFTEEESIMIAGSSDFLGINFYTSNVVYPELSDLADVSFYADQDISSYQDPTWYTAGSSWLRVTPWWAKH